MQSRFSNMKRPAIDWNDLKYFLATARHGGLTGAADVMETSPATVSRHIAALEKSLQMTLFLRQHAGYLLTDDGSELLKHVEQVERAVMAAERQGHTALEHEIAGDVRFTTTEILAFHLIVPNLHLLRERYPRLSIEMGISLEAANLSRREADLALRVADPTFDSAGGDYIANRAGKMGFALYSLPGQISKMQGAKEVDVWKTLDYVTWEESRSDLPMAKWLKSTFTNKLPALACNSMQAQYTAIKAGLGVGLLPCFVGDRDTSLQRLGSGEPIMSRELWLVYHRDLKASQRINVLRNFIQDLIKTYLY